MNDFKIDEIKEKNRELYKGSVFALSDLVLCNGDIEDLLDRSVSNNYEVDLKEAEKHINENKSVYTCKSADGKKDILICCFFNQKIKNSMSLNNGDVVIFFNCDIDKSFKIKNKGTHIYLLYSNKDTDTIDFKNIPEGLRKSISNEIGAINIFFHDERKPINIKNYNPLFPLVFAGKNPNPNNESSGKLIFTDDLISNEDKSESKTKHKEGIGEIHVRIKNLSFNIESKKLFKLKIHQWAQCLNLCFAQAKKPLKSLSIKQTIGHNKVLLRGLRVNNVGFDPLNRGEKLMGDLRKNEGLYIDKCKISKLKINKGQIRKLTIKDSAIGSLVGRLEKNLYFLKEMTFQGVHFENAFLIEPEDNKDFTFTESEDGVSQKKGFTEYETVKVIMEDVSFSCNPSEDGDFNRNKLAMQKLGYEAHAMQFSGFANQARDKSLTLRYSGIEKLLFSFYGYISDYGGSLSSMFLSLRALIIFSFIFYALSSFDISNYQALKFAFINSLGFFKFGLEKELRVIQNSSDWLSFFFFIHTAFASVIWYLIIMWLKKRFGQK